MKAPSEEQIQIAQRETDRLIGCEIRPLDAFSVVKRRVAVESDVDWSLVECDPSTGRLSRVERGGFLYRTRRTASIGE